MPPPGASELTLIHSAPRPLWMVLQSAKMMDTRTRMVGVESRGVGVNGVAGRTERSS